MSNVRFDEPLVTARGALFGSLAAAVAGGSFAYTVIRRAGERNHGGLFNDFWDYWAAGHILNSGGNPYDRHLVCWPAPAFIPP